MQMLIIKKKIKNVRYKGKDHHHIKYALKSHDPTTIPRFKREGGIEVSHDTF